VAVDGETRVGRRATRVGSLALARRLTAGGPDGNEQLTATTGIVLLLLLAALGVTILRIRGLLSEHMFIGMLLIPPVALKMASTGYRFVRYYTADPAYRRKGPPSAALRMSAPVVVLSTVVVFASGVVLLLLGPSSRGTLLTIHKASFIVWLAFISIHVLGHLPDLSRVLGAKPDRELLELSGSRSGRDARTLSLCGALVAGVVLALVFLPEFGPWLHDARFFHHH
jgi:hypothetical protein